MKGASLGSGRDVGERAEARRSIPVGGWVSGAGAPGAQAATGSPYILDVYPADPDRRIGDDGDPVPCTDDAAEKINGPIDDDYRSSGTRRVEGCLFPEGWWWFGSRDLLHARSCWLAFSVNRIRFDGWGMGVVCFEDSRPWIMKKETVFVEKNQIPRENVYGRSLGSFGKGENGTHIKRKYVLWNNKSDRYLFLLWLPFEVFRHAFRQWWPISMRQSRNLYIKWKYFWSTSYKDNCMIIYYYNLACTLTTLQNI